MSLILVSIFLKIFILIFMFIILLIIGEFRIFFEKAPTGLPRIATDVGASIFPLCISKSGFRNFLPPPKYEGIEFPERPKLKFVDKVPQYPSNIRPPKMQKRLRYMRGPELLHNTLQHRQYGIIATGGGRLKWGHFEMIRLTLGRHIDTNRMFLVWRVDAPWQPITKKGQGQRMGGGKGAIDHYITPVKAGRVIVELAGNCEFTEVKGFLQDVAAKLPFSAEAVSQEMLDRQLEKEEKQAKMNINPYTMKYVIQNNMGGCHNWLSPVDHKWFGKYH